MWGQPPSAARGVLRGSAPVGASECSAVPRQSRQRR